MGTQQCSLLVAILHRLASVGTVRHEMIDDFAEAIGLERASIASPAPEVGMPTLTIEEPGASKG